VLTDRRIRFEDLLFVALLLLPTVFAAARYLQSKSQMELIALHNRLPAVMLAKASAANSWTDANTSIVHRF
jgi:hypothetical protein